MIGFGNDIIYISRASPAGKMNMSFQFTTTPKCVLVAMGGEDETDPSRHLHMSLTFGEAAALREWLGKRLDAHAGFSHG